MRLVFFLAASLWISLPAAAQILFSDDFQDGDANGWSAGGQGKVQITNYQGNYSLQLSKSAFAAIGLNVSGPEEVAISVSFAAAELEKKDACRAEASNDGGKSWQLLHEVKDGMDDSVSLHVGGGRIATPKEGPLFLRLRADANGSNDTCWADNITIRAVNQRTAAGPKGPRTHLFSQTLKAGKSMPAPVPMAAFDAPLDAQPAKHAFTGSLKFTPPNQAASFSVLRDRFNFMVDPLDGVTVPPTFELDFLQSGDRILPTKRGLVRTRNKAWDIIVDVGRVWQEAGDGEYSRAAIPFALQERNANCTHNGVMTFLYNAAGGITHAAYQISAETCAYFQYDMWGLAQMHYAPGAVSNAGHTLEAYTSEVTDRLPTKPFSSLQKDHPKLDISKFAAPEDISPDHLTTYGAVIDGIHYRADCQTRQGAYPFCDEMALPSYSTSKSTFAGLALMRLELLYPGASRALIADYVPECAAAGWEDVTFGHALDMATGRYNRSGGEADENAAVRDGFFTDPNHAEKIARACTMFPRKKAPGQTWVYHTTDHYVLGTAIQAFLKERAGPDADIYDTLLVEPVWSALGLSPVAGKTRRTRGAVNQPYVGWGLTYLADDLAKLARFFSVEDGIKNGEALIDLKALASAMQERGDDIGLPAPGKGLRYNNGVWALDAAPFVGCKRPLWVPFMSGFGGLSVVMMPNDIIYYYISDNYEFAWASAVKAANEYRPMCVNAQ